MEEISKNEWMPDKTVYHSSNQLDDKEIEPMVLCDVQVLFQKDGLQLKIGIKLKCMFQKSGVLGK